MSEQLYRAIDLSEIIKTGESSEPLLYVGVYVMSWGLRHQPEVGFLPAEDTIYTQKLQEFLDEAIKDWRNKRQLGSLVADSYIDAYQTVREAMLGEILPT